MRSRTRCCGGIRRRGGSRPSAGRARTAATGGSHCACCRRRAATSSEELARSADVVIDALFGTGFQGEPREDAAALIERINGAGTPVVAVDVPVGRRRVHRRDRRRCSRADVTVTMHGPKVGTVVAPGRFHAGEVEVAEIGIEPARDGAPARDGGDPRARPAQARACTKYRQAPCSSSAARRG